uniref:Putative conserved plasma membrane protein n=1 Tax=Ornithodoros turicata TaxID=34597 RepID=A0A2R5L958_9ACAR
MHTVLLGVVRMFLLIWLDSKHRKKVWYLGRCKQAIDMRLMQIKPPDFVTRTPRSIAERMYWKANEYRSWLLYYSLPVLSGILPQEHFSHYMLLVAAIYLLLQDSVSQKDLNSAELFLKKFVSRVGDLYGREFYTFNMHQLPHATLSVLRWGPLWSTSAFSFEGRNAELLRMVHGTQNIAKQLASLAGVGNALACLENRARMSPLAGAILRQLQGVHFSKASCDSGKILLHGKPCRPSGDVLSAISSLQQSGSNLRIYKRATKGTCTFISKIYEGQSRRNDYTVTFRTEREARYANILCFAQDSGEVYVLLQELSIQSERLFRDRNMDIVLPHLIPVSNTEQFLMIPATLPLVKCVRVLNYVCVRPNTVEQNL